MDPYERFGERAAEVRARDDRVLEAISRKPWIAIEHVVIVTNMGPITGRIKRLLELGHIEVIPNETTTGDCGSQRVSATPSGMCYLADTLRCAFSVGFWQEED